LVLFDYMALIETLTDDFNDNSIDSGLWSTYTGGAGCSVTETGGQIECTGASASGNEAQLYSNSSYDLSESYVEVEITGSGGAGSDSYIYVQDSSFNRLGFSHNGSFLSAKYANATLASTAWSAGSGYWVRIREASGTIYFDYSDDDRDSWTNLHSDTVGNFSGFDETSVSLLIGIYVWGGITGLTATYNGVNTSVAGPDIDIDLTSTLQGIYVFNG